jgi:hypothetical protein
MHRRACVNCETTLQTAIIEGSSSEMDLALAQGAWYQSIGLP